MTEKHDIGDASQILIFTIGEEAYGIDIKKVQEIRGKEAITAIPGTHAYQKGIINLRGEIVPIIDLRIKFQISDGTFDNLTTFIIVSIQQRLVGIIVDRVSDVVTLTPDQIKPMSKSAGQLSKNSITGIATLEDRLIILLDIDELVGAIDLLDAYE